MTMTKQQRDLEWTSYHYLALHIIREGMHFEDGSVPPDVDERIDDAMAHAWVRFERICETRPDATAKSRVRWAAKTGVLRVRSGRRFVVTRKHRYVDAMDVRGRRAEYLEAQVEQPVACGYRDPSDRTIAEEIIAKLPENLQPVARLFSYGQTKETVADRRGISRTSLYSLIGELRKLVPDTLPEPKPAETETEPVRRFCPVRAMVTAIAIAYEHNRCYRPECVAYVIDERHVVIEDR